MAGMTELPAGDDHEVIYLRGQAAVVVPIEEYRRLRGLEQQARRSEQADAEEAAALVEYRAQQRAGTVVAVPQDEVRRRFGLTQ
jgi:hypothetical protein